MTDPKIIISGDVFYGYALDCAKDWVSQYNKEGRIGLCGFSSPRANVHGSVSVLKSGTYRVYVFEGA